MPLSPTDRSYLRDLATRVAEIAADPYNDERRQWWFRHNDLSPVRPMVLVFPEGSWEELLPQSTMRLEDPFWRRQEWYLRHKIYRWEHLRDDNVIEPSIEVGPPRGATGWGVQTGMRPSGLSRGASAYNPAFRSPEDFAMMQRPRFEVDRATKREIEEQMGDVFGDIIQFRWKRSPGIDTSLVGHVCHLRGLQQVMMDMVDRPEWLHEVFTFLTDNTQRLLDELEASGELELMDGEDYPGSGGTCYTHDLPAPDFGGTVRLKDVWGFAESQEYTLVSPRMYDEFGLRYQAPLVARYGLNCCGCCEDITDKLDLIIERIPRLRRISISPWTDVAVAAEKLQDRHIFSWKPNPTCVVNPYDPARTRAEIRRTLEITRGCVMEMILKDTHTCNHHPERMSEWVKIAQEEAERAVA